jgi:hypothetical protein
MFKKAPFGLKPLSSLFQRGMSRILGDLDFVRNFIDDIVRNGQGYQTGR